MTSVTSNNFITKVAWFKAVLGNEDVILCHTSAMECLQFFLGWLNEKTIDVYAKKSGIYENVNYRIVDTFDGIETVTIAGLRCTSMNQTVNDMLDDPHSIYDQPLIEGLADYYYENGESFDTLSIKPEYMERFNIVSEWAKEHYNTG